MQVTSSALQAASLATDAQQPQPGGSGIDKLANKEMFLQLLVAQIRNQDPLQPTEGVEFLTQLAQFSQLEQLMGIRSELTALGENADPAAAGPGSGQALPPVA